MNFKNIIVSGSSITDDTAWPTWYNWIKRRFDLRNAKNISVKGLGNEAIILHAVAEAEHTTNPYIIIQLTSVDKWDWYVEDKNLINILEKEKHPINRINNDEFGFWSTGSHFPLFKEHFKSNYFSVRHQTLQTLILIQWFQSLCLAKKWNYLILFDSPIFSVTESLLNQGILSIDQCNSYSLVDNPLCKFIFNNLDVDKIYTPGLIGFAKLNNLPWYHSKYKCHPGSLTHFEFAKTIVDPILSMEFTPCLDFDELYYEAKKFQSLSDD